MTLLMVKTPSDGRPMAAVASVEAAQAVSRLCGDVWLRVMTEQMCEPWEPGFVGGLPSFMMHDGGAIETTQVATRWESLPVLSRSIK